MLRKLASVALILMGLVGCVSVPMGDPQQDLALKAFSAKPDVAGIYIYRNETMGAAVRMDVEVDGKPLGQTGANTYFYTEVSPGKHMVTSKAENTDSLEVDTVAGKLYYIWQEVKMGVLYARTKLHLVTEAEGKKGVLETKLAAPVGYAATAPTRVTLKDGRTYEVETVRGLPVGFANDQIRVLDLGITARSTPGNADVPPFVRVLVAELIAGGQFAVTVTTPLDSSASATLEATGPGRIMLRFFPQADYPRIWEGMDQPGIHWFPFHFAFEEKQSKKRFEFTQWAQMDYSTWKEMRELNEQMKEKYFKK